MTFEELKTYLYDMRAFGSRLGLERMHRFCAALGHPETAVPTIHVAGTNGKGSVCALLESSLRAAGYRVGLFTSPHLVYLGERIQIDREPISPAKLAQLAEKLKSVADAIEILSPEAAPTFFEFMTGAAFLYFAREKVDVAVIETGLGGRFDSTHVISPEITAITSIGLDHTEYLGDTLQKIAHEKGGIFKKSVPAVLGEIPYYAELELRQEAGLMGAMPLRTITERFGHDKAAWPHSALAGEYQRKNAATAQLVLEMLQTRFPRLNEPSIRRGFETVRWDGRWQTLALCDGRDLILEGSHNPEGAQVLDEQLSVLTAAGKSVCAVTGVCGLTRAQAILPVLARHARAVYLVEVEQPRACTFAQMREILENCGYRGPCVETRVEAIFPEPGVCRAGEQGDTVVAAGSLYLVGEVLAQVQPPRWGASGLGLQDWLV